MTWMIPVNAKIGRVALHVNNLPRMTDFYEQVIGLSVESRGDGRTVLGVDGTSLLILTEDQGASPRQPDETGLFHTAFRFPNRSALANALHRVESRHELDGAADHDVSEALYLSDPEGNGIELYRDRPQEGWPEDEEGMVAMPTKQLDIGDLREESAGSADAPAGMTVGHVHLEVSEIDAARRFYVDTLGFTIRQDMGSALFVAAGDYHHHIGLNTWNGRSQPADGRGLGWFEILVPDKETMETIQERCDSVAVIDDGFRVNDPDNIQIKVRQA